MFSLVLTFALIAQSAAISSNLGDLCLAESKDKCSEGTYIENDDWMKDFKDNTVNFLVYGNSNYLVDLNSIKDTIANASFVSKVEGKPIVKVAESTFGTSVLLIFTGIIIATDGKSGFDVKTPMKLINSEFDESTAQMKCSTSKMTIDPSTSKSLYKNNQNCIPKSIELIDFDEFDLVYFTKDSIKFTAKEADETSFRTLDKIPSLNLETKVKKLKLDSDGNPSGEFHFHMTTEDHELVVGKIPKDFEGLYGVGINGILTVENGIVPIDVTANKHVIMNSTTDVTIYRAWCTNTFLEFTKMNEGTTATWDQAYFGRLSNIRNIPKGITFRINDGYHNQNWPLAAPVDRLTITKTLYIWPESLFSVDNLTLEETAELDVKISLEHFDDLSLKPKWHIPYLATDIDEASPVKHFKKVSVRFLENFSLNKAKNETGITDRPHKNSHETLLLCGKNYECDAFASSIDYKGFDGRQMMRLECVKDYMDGKTCIVIKTDVGNSVRIAGIVIGIVAIVAIPIYIFFFIKNKKTPKQEFQLYQSLK